MTLAELIGALLKYDEENINFNLDEKRKERRIYFELNYDNEYIFAKGVEAKRMSFSVHCDSPCYLSEEEFNQQTPWPYESEDAKVDYSYSFANKIGGWLWIIYFCNKKDNIQLLQNKKIKALINNFGEFRKKFQIVTISNVKFECGCEKLMIGRFNSKPNPEIIKLILDFIFS